MLNKISLQTPIKRHFCLCFSCSFILICFKNSNIAFLQLRSMQDLHTNQKLVYGIFKSNTHKKKNKKAHKTQSQVTPIPQKNFPLLNVVFCWMSTIILIASWSWSKQAESRDKHTTREPRRRESKLYCEISLQCKHMYVTN